MAITKLDVLDSLDVVKVCVAYEIDGRRTEDMPYHQSDVHRARPVLEEFAGWRTPLGEVRRPADLPTSAADYVRFVERQAGVPVTVVGVGPRRRQFVRLSTPAQ